MSIGNFWAVRRTFFQKSRNFSPAASGARRRPLGFGAGDRAGRGRSRDGLVRRRFPGRPVMARALAPAAAVVGALGSPAAAEPVGSSTGSDRDGTGGPDRPRSGPRRSRLARPTGRGRQSPRSGGVVRRGTDADFRPVRPARSRGEPGGPIRPGGMGDNQPWVGPSSGVPVAGPVPVSGPGPWPPPFRVRGLSRSRAGCGPRAGRPSGRGYRSSWCGHPCGRAAPGWCGDRARIRAGGSRSYA
jgi:hypothetical protein